MLDSRTKSRRRTRLTRSWAIFLRGLTSGDLLSDRFAYYVAQDADYLRDLPAR